MERFFRFISVSTLKLLLNTSYTRRWSRKWSKKIKGSKNGCCAITKITVMTSKTSTHRRTACTQRVSRCRKTNSA